MNFRSSSTTPRRARCGLKSKNFAAPRANGCKSSRASSTTFLRCTPPPRVPASRNSPSRSAIFKTPAAMPRAASASRRLLANRVKETFAHAADHIDVPAGLDLHLDALIARGEFHLDFLQQLLHGILNAD